MATLKVNLTAVANACDQDITPAGVTASAANNRSNRSGSVEACVHALGMGLHLLQLKPITIRTGTCFAGPPPFF